MQKTMKLKSVIKKPKPSPKTILMKKSIIYSILLLLSLRSLGQTQQRITLTSTVASEYTGQIYAPWLNDNLDDLVSNVWSANNFRYVDVTLPLQQQSQVNLVSLYDYEGIFTDNPATIYALNGNQKTLLGTFTGDRYKAWVDINLQKPVTADAIIIHKYGNNIPQKIRVFGQASLSQGHSVQLIQSIINLAELSQKNLGDRSFDLIATSNNTSTPITFSSSNTDVVSVTLANDVWKATIVGPGKAEIKASQAGNANYIAASDVIKTQVINAALIQSFISFPDLPARMPGDASFELNATSNNTVTPVTYTSSNSSIVAVSNIDGVWKETFLAPGTALITASQEAVGNFTSAVNVVKTQIVNAIPSGNESGRIKVVSVTPGNIQDFSAWLNDDENNLVANSWLPLNFQYSDVALLLESRTIVSRISLYDFEGTFTNKPALIYAVNGDQKTLLGTFTGEKYKEWINIDIQKPVIADSIVVHKYGNNIPQKIKIYGQAVTTIQATPSVISFTELPAKFTGDEPFKLAATSNNTASSITFASSDNNVVSVNYVEGAWKASIISEGTATITASQAGNANFLPATDVVRTQVVNSTVSAPVVSGKIPIDPKRWYQLNNTSNGLEGLFDGNTTAAVSTGWGQILSNYDAYYPLLDGEELNIDRIRFYDAAGTNTKAPFTLSIITAAWKRIPIATFTGTEYMKWVGPYPGRKTKGDEQYKLDKTISNARYLVINTSGAFPTEMEMYGTYKAAPAATPVPAKSIKLKDALGVNAFEWDFEHPNNPSTIDETRMKAVKSFTGVRHYLDWEKLELKQGSYTYNPSYSGGWNYDTIYARCKSEGIEVLACLKTIPGWMQSTYPGDQRDMENVPVRYGKSFSDPNSYIEQAKVAFQYAARYGSNTQVDPSLLTVNSTPRWNNDNVNTVKIGMGLIKYIECDNERDKWWKGRKAYQTGREYAANLSAFYDGNKNTMGAGVGVKNADPDMKVVMGGLAAASTDYVRGMIDWCKEFRGYKDDGKVNLCWDIINYHLYSNDAKNSQGGNSTRGSAPEVSEAKSVALNFTTAAHNYAYDMPVWITECGYDVNQGSSLKAIAIGKKSVLETQADWILRTALLYVRSGLQKVFFYQLTDDNINSSQKFSSSGLINGDRTRKPAADFLYQVNKLFGEYTYKQTLNTSPVVDRYELKGQSAYVLYIPDEKGKTGNYNLSLDNSDSVYIYKPKAGSDDMDVQKIKIRNNGKIEIPVSETPVFVIPVGSKKLSDVQNRVINVVAGLDMAAIEAGKMYDNAVKLYPNPAVNVINLSITNNSEKQVEVRVFEAGSGKLRKSLSFTKEATTIAKAIDINSLNYGLYIFEILQGSDRTVKKFIKTVN